MHQAINAGLIRACHDPSEGGLAVAVAEMAFAGGCGAKIRLTDTPHDGTIDPREGDLDTVLLFSESASRFVVEVTPANRAAFEHVLKKHDVPHAHIGEVADHGRVQVAAAASGGLLIDLPIHQLKEAWQKPLRW